MFCLPGGSFCTSEGLCLSRAIFCTVSTILREVRAVFCCDSLVYRDACYGVEHVELATVPVEIDIQQLAVRSDRAVISDSKLVCSICAVHKTLTYERKLVQLTAGRV